MVEIILILLTMLCTNPDPSHKGSECNGIQITTTSDTGGETGNVPPTPPPPPPSPSGN